MGAWGPGIFENDPAADWVCKLPRGNEDLIVRTLANVEEAEPIDWDDDQDPWRAFDDDDEVLAAAELVTVIFGLPSDELDPSIPDWLELKQRQVDPSTITMALSAVRRVIRGYEWRIAKEPWSSEDAERWLTPRRELESRLMRLAAQPNPRPVPPETWNKSVRGARADAGMSPTQEELAWQEGKGDTPPERTLQFPADRPLGTLYVRDWDAPDSHASCNRLCLARGAVTIPAGQAVELWARFITAEGLPRLAELRPRDLQFLSISGDDITDSSLVALHGLSGLIEVELSYTSVTAEGASALQEALPNCRVDWQERQPLPWE